MTNGHCNAEHTNRPFSFQPNVAAFIALCRAPNFWDSPTAELDMFSRWIQVADKALATSARFRKKAADRSRASFRILSSPKPV
jgi:hypothetical protein